MKFETPADRNPIDNGTVIGKPHPRIEGPLKTAGRATYAYEQWDLPAKPAYGWVVGSAIAKGRIASLDTTRAKAAAGVLEVVTAASAAIPAKGRRNTARLLAGPEIEHYHQAVAIVIAESFEQARHAAGLLDIRYERAEGHFDLAARKPAAVKPENGDPDSARGDFEGAFAAAPVQIDATYTTPDETHAMMEPHASIAMWEGDALTVWTSNQMIAWNRKDLAKALGIDAEKVRLISPYIGGGFGAKLFLRSDLVAAAVASRAVGGRPVKVALQRPLVANNTTHRPATIQRIRIGTDHKGKILAIGHENWCGDLPGGSADSSVDQTRQLYAGEHRMTRTRLATLDLPESNAMRAPGEATGMMALEIAMDEAAEKLGMDPVEFRILNDTQVVPEQPELAFSQRNLTGCLREGARRFGWDRRTAPGTRREGRWLVGLGMAAAFRNNMNQKSAARVRLAPDGKVIVETDMTDIGTGSYTIIAQTAAEMLGLPIEAVEVKLGDSTFPAAAGSGGQWGGNSSTSGVYAACVKLRGAIAQRLGVDPTTAEFVGGQVRSSNRSYPLSDATRAGELVAEDAMEWGEISKKYKQATFGAHFVEAAVDAWTGEIRVRRMLAVCAAGRILNPQTARSQVIGAMTMGVGAALMEELAVDHRFGFFVNHDLAGYEVPVHADIPHQEVAFLDEVDDKVSPMKAKGVAELGICGVAAAVANAVHNATGLRIRDYPLTLDKLLEHLPEVA